MIKLWPNMKIDTDVVRGFVLGLILICMSLSMAFENNGLEEDGMIQHTEGVNAPGFVSGSIFTDDSFASGGRHNCAIANESLNCWGSNVFSQLGNSSGGAVDFSGLYNQPSAVSVAIGNYHTCAVMNDATVACWGGNTYGQSRQSGNSTLPSPPTAISFGERLGITVATGKTHSCAILDNASVNCWGYNNHGQLGDGTVNSSNVPVWVDLGDNVSAVSLTAGDSHTCALTNNGTMMCWGYNSQGQLGDGTTNNSYIPVSIDFDVKRAVAISAGGEHTCALLDDARAHCWGWNDRGQLGDGTLLSQSTPTEITTDSNVTAIATGERHTCGLLDNSSIMCWGNNADGQLGDNSTSNSSIPQYVHTNTSFDAVSLTAGISHTCAVSSSGDVQCWGDNQPDQLGDGTGNASLVP